MINNFNFELLLFWLLMFSTYNIILSFESNTKCSHVCKLKYFKYDHLKKWESAKFGRKKGNCFNDLKVDSIPVKFESIILNQTFSRISIIIDYSIFPQECMPYSKIYKYQIKSKTLDHFKNVMFMDHNHTDMAFVKKEYSLNDQNSFVEAIYDLEHDKKFHHFVVNLINPNNDLYALGDWIVYLKDQHREKSELSIPSPSIYWYLNFSTDFVDIFLFSTYYNLNPVKKSSIFLFEDSKVNFWLRKTDENNASFKKYDKIKSNRTQPYQIKYRINNLENNTEYELMLTYNNGSIYALSNKIKFKTLSNPKIILKKETSEFLNISYFVDCEAQKLIDLDVNYPHSMDKNDIAYTNKFYLNDGLYINSTKIYTRKKSKWSEISFNKLQIESLINENFEHLDNENYYLVLHVSYKSDLILKSNPIAINIDKTRLNKKTKNKTETIVGTNLKQKNQVNNHLFIFYVIQILGSVIGTTLAMLLVFYLIKKLQIRRNLRSKLFEKKGVELKEMNSLSSSDLLNNDFYFSANNLKIRAYDDLEKLSKIKEADVKFGDLIGGGTFGEVVKGELKDSVTVAVKKLKNYSNKLEIIDFLKESIFLNSLNHDNITKFLGICLENNNNYNRPKFILIEYMNKGDLLRYIHNLSELKFEIIIKVSLDIVKACEYLELVQLVHRDIAARNCLININEEKLTAKLGDFGLSKEIYSNHYYRQKNDQKALPIRWMAPESISFAIFDNKSDVWSFGVLIWELITKGYHPYTGLTNEQVINYIIEGFILPIPNNCPLEIKQIFCQCWDKREKRASFRTLSSNIQLLFENKEKTKLLSDLNKLPLNDFDNTKKTKYQDLVYNYLDQTDDGIMSIN